MIRQLYRSLDDCADVARRSFIVAQSDEERCRALPQAILDRGGQVLVVEHGDLSSRQLLDVVSVSDGDEVVDLALRDTEQIAKVLQAQDRPTTIDISCLPHAVWSAFVRAAVLHGIDLVAWYVEPEAYTSSSEQIRTGRDLSRSVGGVGPLPGFSSLAVTSERARHVVFLLGFEGSRLGHVAAALDCSGADVTVVLPDPGLRQEYAEFALEGNRQALRRIGVDPHGDLIRCPASEPLSVVARLALLANPDQDMTIVPLGPRTHALGAVTYYLREEAAGRPTPRLVYDHAVRNPEGSRGMGTIYGYDILELFSADLD